MATHPARRHITLPGTLFPAIDEYRFNQRIPTRTEAIERLIRAGLKALTQPPDGPQAPSHPAARSGV